MIRMCSLFEIADNTGAKKASCIGVLHRGNRLYAEVGDIISANVKEVTPTSIIKKGEVVKAVIVRTVNRIARADGSYLKFDSNAAVIIDQQKNPRGTRVFGPVARELREKNFMKIVSLAPEVI